MEPVEESDWEDYKIALSVTSAKDIEVSRRQQQCMACRQCTVQGQIVFHPILAETGGLDHFFGRTGQLGDFERREPGNYAMASGGVRDQKFCAMRTKEL